MPKNTTQLAWAWLEPRPLEPESNVLTIRPVRLPQCMKWNLVPRASFSKGKALERWVQWRHAISLLDTKIIHFSELLLTRVKCELFYPIRLCGTLCRKNSFSNTNTLKILFSVVTRVPWSILKWPSMTFCRTSLALLKVTNHRNDLSLDLYL